MNRIEVYEKYEVESPDGHDAEYYRNILPSGANLPEPEYSYRRTMILVDTIERPIEIEGSEDEMILRMYGAEDMTIKANYDEFCLTLHDIEEQMYIEEEEIAQQIEQKIANQ